MNKEQRAEFKRGIDECVDRSVNGYRDQAMEALFLGQFAYSARLFWLYARVKAKVSLIRAGLIK